MELVSFPAATAAGAARVPEPKNAFVSVSYAETGAASAVAKIVRGFVSSSSGICATDSVFDCASHDGAL